MNLSHVPASALAWRSRWSNRQWTLDRWITLLMLLVIAFVALNSAVQSDTWWLLRTGHYIVQTQRIPTRDVFSSTVFGGAWPNHEWLAAVLFYLVYSLGGLPLMLVLVATLITATWWVILRMCDGPLRLRVYIALLAVGVQVVNWSVRPNLFSLLAFTVTLLLLPDRRRHWLYPPLFLVWANLHGGVAFGGVVLAAACLAACFTDRRSLEHWLVVSICSLLATLINPLGVGLWSLILHSLDNPILKYTSEWQAPRLDWPASYPYLLLVLGCGVSVWRARRVWQGQRDWTLLLCALIFALLGFRAMRHTAFFALVAPLIMSRQVAHVSLQAVRLSRRGLIHAALLAILAIAGTIFTAVRWSTEVVPAPLSAATIAAVRQCDGRLFNTYNDGGFLIWWVPERPVFVDSRQDPFPAPLIRRTIEAEYAGEYRALFAAYDVRCALVPVARPLAQALAQDGWHVLARDTTYVVLRKPNT